MVLYHKWAINLRGSDQDNIEGLIYVALPRIMSHILAALAQQWAVNTVFKRDGFIDSELLFSLQKHPFLFAAGDVSLGGTTFLHAKRPKRWRKRGNGCFCRLAFVICNSVYLGACSACVCVFVCLRTAAGLAQSVQRLTAEREVAGSIPGAGPILRVLK